MESRRLPIGNEPAQAFEHYPDSQVLRRITPCLPSELHLSLNLEKGSEDSFFDRDMAVQPRCELAKGND